MTAVGTAPMQRLEPLERIYQWLQTAPMTAVETAPISGWNRSNACNMKEVEARMHAIFFLRVAFAIGISVLAFKKTFLHLSPSFLGRFFQNRPTLAGARSSFRWLSSRLRLLRWLFAQLCSLSTMIGLRLVS